jgi:hypothetical protein
MTTYRISGECVCVSAFRSDCRHNIRSYLNLSVRIGVLIVSVFAYILSQGFVFEINHANRAVQCYMLVLKLAKRLRILSDAYASVWIFNKRKNLIVFLTKGMHGSRIDVCCT